MTEHTPQTDSGGDSARLGWVIVLLICAALLGWGFLQFATIRDEPRRWDFNVHADAPGEGEASTARPDLSAPAPRQIAPLPEARKSTGEAGAAGVSSADEPSSRPSRKAAASEAPAVPGGSP